MVLPHVALDWLWYRFFCVFMVLRHVAFDLLWHCLSLFSWFFLMLHWIDCDIVYLCSHGSLTYFIGLIVTLFICVLMVLSLVALDWFWHCLSVFLWVFPMLHWIDCDIVYLCSYGSPSCCIELIVILLFCVFMVLTHVALNWLWYRFFLCFHGSSSWCFWFFLTLFIFVLLVLPPVALNWLWHWLSVFLWVFLMLHWIDCDIVYLCSYWTSSCCIGLILALFICVLMVLPHVALNWLWHCLSVFSLFFLMSHWIDCGIVYLCSHGSSSCCIGLIVTLFISVFMVPPHVALDWFWHCLSVFLWVFLMLHGIDCDIVNLCSRASSSCCIWLIVILFISVLMVLPHVALDWLWHCLSVLSLVFIM